MGGQGSGVEDQGSGAGSSALVITAKYPYPGAVKTRLASRLGFGLATEVCRAFLRDLDAAFPRAFWAYTPNDSPFPSFLGTGRRYLVQEGGDLGERMFNLFRHLCSQGFEKVVLVGSDIPQLTPALVDRAFAVMDICDVALGPAADGGYYLIGMRVAHDLFSSVNWSTCRVLAQTLAKAAERGLRVGLLPQTFDVDGPEDIDRLLSLVRGQGVNGCMTDKRMRGGQISVDAVPHRWIDDPLAGCPEAECAPASLPHASAILSQIRRADATLERSKVGWHYRTTPAQVEKEERACLDLIRQEELSQQIREHMALVAGVASVLVARLREDLDITLSDVAVVAARYHDACRSEDRSHRLRPYGVGPKGLLFTHDGHEARLAFDLRRVGARTIARIVRRHNVLRPLHPEARTIDDNVLVIADAMVEAGEIVPIAVRREAIIARHADADPQGARAYSAAYDVVERTLDLYFDAGVNRRRFQRELGLIQNDNTG
ncbi:MAG: TIGR04282 family arsenosugar biosynthesis glycosyltransferase [Chloroflexi bacterium]|nr:TIGR04282 family arsenosugar biosynthesis glycosyltransferase [Chloroflexota bacterium]